MVEHQLPKLRVAGSIPVSRSIRAALVALLLAVSSFGCSPAPDPPLPRLVLLYAPCTVNRSFLGPYDPSVRFTPALDRLAAKGVVFERHWSEAGQSGIAYASILSGTQAPDHRIYSHPTRIDDDVVLVAEPFVDAGYESFFWGGHLLASGRYNYGQGTDAPRVFDRALAAEDPEWVELIERLRTDTEYRAVVATTFSVTHAPYSPEPLNEFCRHYPDDCAVRQENPERFAEYAEIHHRNHRDLANNFPETVARLGLDQSDIDAMAGALELLYKANIYRLDRDFGALLDSLESAGLLEESLIAFTADHGETLYRQNALFKWGHGWELAPEVLAVPWIVRGPPALDLPPRFQAVTRSTDVFPTLAGLAGVPLARDRPLPTMGVDLTPALTRAEPAPELEAFSHTVVQHPDALSRIQSATLWLQYHESVNNGRMWVSMQTRQYQYKYRNLDGEQWGFQRFDLTEDPSVAEDGFDPGDPVDRAAARRLLEYRERLIAAWPGNEGPALDEEAMRALRSLGYVE